MIEFRHVYKTFPGPIHALRNLSFEITKNDFVYLTGPSGAGKTTIFKLILGMDEQTAGEIHIFNRPMQNVRRHELKDFRRKIGVVFQDFKLIPGRTVFENVALPLHILKFDRNNIAARVAETLTQLKINHYENCFPEMLSGGEQQRVAIARALVHKPELIIADEPTGNLDPSLRDDIMNLLESVPATRMIITHDLEMVKQRGHRSIQLLRGEMTA